VVPAGEGLTRLGCGAGSGKRDASDGHAPVVAPAAIGACLVAAGAAHGAVLIGSSLAPEAGQSICTSGVACTYLQTLGGVPAATAPFHGITAWRVKSGTAAAMGRSA
jgi:hypothetical protein